VTVPPVRKILRKDTTPQGEAGMATHLRVYPTVDEEPDLDFPSAKVRIRLGDLLPLVAMAQRNNYLWLQDFLEDEVAITGDLYEVLRTFRSYRPSA
jgi:hypothetical protein